MAVTLAAIAKESGYSVATVSRALTNPDYPVNVATRQRIKEVAQAMGYQPNMAARSLRTDHTSTIGIIADDILSPFVPPIIRGIQDYLKDYEFLSLIINSDWDPDIEQDAIRALISRPVDGIVFVESSHLAVNESLQRSGKPYVFAHRLFGATVQNSVVPDEPYGAALGVRHLAGLGHRRVALIKGREGWHPAERRHAGYRAELEKQSLDYEPALVQPGDWEYEGGYSAAGRLLALPSPPTAIFASNDLMALGAICALQDAGRSIPSDVAVVGYDNRDFTRIVRPRITTVSMPVYEMGRKAAELLLRQIANGHESLDEIQIKGQLVVRESCGAERARQTTEELDIATVSRRILLRKDPDR